MTLEDQTSRPDPDAPQPHRPDYTIPPWQTPPRPSTLPPSALPPGPPERRVPPPLPGPVPAPAAAAADPSSPQELGGGEREMVKQLQDRVATRLAKEDVNFPASALRPRTRRLIREEYEKLLASRATAGQPPPEEDREQLIVAATLAEIEGLGRLAPILARTDVEDCHIVGGGEPTMLRLTNGDLVHGPVVGDTDVEVIELIRKLGSRQFEGQTTRDFSRASPTLSMKLPAATPLGARMQAGMDVLPTPMACIRIHHHSETTLLDMIGLGMIDRPLYSFLHAAVRGRAHILVIGELGAGKTALLRALLTSITWNRVISTVEDERELGIHLPRWDAQTQSMRKLHAVCYPYEARHAGPEGGGEFGMGDAIHATARTSTEYLVVGETRGAYVRFLLKAASDGISTVMGTLHAESADDVFRKVLASAQEPLAGHVAPERDLIANTLASIDLIVHVERDEQWNRYVTAVHEVGRVNRDTGEPTMNPIFAPGPDERAVRDIGHLSPRLAKKLRRGGLPDDWSSEPSTWGPLPRGARR